MSVKARCFESGDQVGGEEEGRVGDDDLAGRFEPVLRADHEAVFARRIRKPGDVPTVGRPGGTALGDSGGAGQVAPVAVLRGNGEDVAPTLEERADAGG